MKQLEVHNRTFPLLIIFIFVACLVPLSISAQTFLYNQTSVAAGNGPSGIAVADFNGDGRADLAVVNQSDNTVSLILEKADGSFAPKVDYKVGAGPVALVAADFNGDQIPDLAVVNSQDDTISILLGTGGGVFGSQVSYPTGALPFAIVAVDLNGDKKLDLAVSNVHDSTVSLFLGNGDGSFAGQSIVTLPSGSGSIASGDVNNDGMPDLVVLNDSGITLLLNTGSARFSVSSIYVDVAGGGGLIVADFDGDGRLDVAYPAPTSTGADLVVLAGDGSGGFRTNVSQLNIIGVPGFVVAGDFNNDGKLDLAMATNDLQSIFLILGKGDGTFQPPRFFGFSQAISALVAADFNNDNCLDLAAANQFGDVVTVLLGNGLGNVGGNTDYVMPFAQEIGGTVAADFTSDGKPDLAVIQTSQSGQGIDGVSVFPDNSNGALQSPITTQAANLGLGQMVAGDFDGDGKMDIAIAAAEFSSGLAVMLGNGDGTFAAPTPIPVDLTGFETQAISVGDFNNDGKQDLVSLFTVPGGSPKLYILLSNGDATFQQALVDPIPNAVGLTTADLNHDGNLDIVVAQSKAGLTPSSALVFLGRGDGSFSGPTEWDTGTDDAYAVAAADFNGDGKIDLVVGTDKGVFFFAGKGDGNFQSPENTALVSLGFLIAGDFSGDGKADLLLGPVSGGEYDAIAVGNGDGTFQPEMLFEPTYFANYPAVPPTAVADFNGDGILDMARLSFVLGYGGVETGEVESVWTSVPTVTFSASGASFISPSVGSSAGPIFIQLNNIGNAPLSISKIAASGAFSESNNCPVTLPIGHSCRVGVSFTPTASGLNSGYLQVTNNASSGTQNLLLTGWSGPADFLISATPSLTSVQAGASADYTITLTAEGGFNGTVQLACAGLPSKSVCNFSQPSLLLNGSAAVGLIVTTTAPSTTSLAHGDRFQFMGPGLLSFLLVTACAWLRIRKPPRALAVVTCALVLLLVSCGGGSGGNSGGGGGGGIVPGTPSGSYDLTVSGTSGSLSHNAAIELAVTSN